MKYRHIVKMQKLFSLSSGSFLLIRSEIVIFLVFFFQRKSMRVLAHEKIYEKLTSIQLVVAITVKQSKIIRVYNTRNS